MEEAEHTPDLSDIMDSIQDLALTLASIHLASGRRQTGEHRRLERTQQTKVQISGHAGEVSTCTRLPPYQQPTSRGKEQRLKELWSLWGCQVNPT